MMHTITRFALSAALLVAPRAFAQDSTPEMSCDSHDWDGERVTHCEINETTIAAVQLLTVDGGVNGGVRVRGWQKSQILVRAKVQTSADTDARARDMARLITIRTGGSRIVADGPSSYERHENWSVSYEVFVPQQIDLSLKAHNGGIRISDVRGHIEFVTTNGGVSLQRLAGNVQGHTTNGGLSVELAGSRWDGEQLDATTTNGGVSLAVPEAYSAHLETGTVNGHINIDFPLTVHGEINRRLSVDLGSGGSTVRAITTNGGVSIHRKDS
ncbi:MAG TPA: DUF4097 family beta strand repeat-containing protein [Bryobacteraceae bacterium]|nr:DUF4097 family beta strand repeat-containing protein [Bryobacteraceae bacterium]